MRCSLCKGRSQKSRALSRPGSAWLAGVREQRWMNWVRPSPSQAWPRFFQALAQLSFPLDSHLPRSKPSFPAVLAALWPGGSPEPSFSSSLAV